LKSDLSLMLFSILGGSCGQILLKYTAGRLGDFSLEWTALPYSVLEIFTNGWVLFGVFCFVASMVLWIKVISGMELSRAYPSAGLSYILVFTFSMVLFKENITLSKVAGLALILAGVFFLHR